jgi:ATP-dependent DNA helicase RecG
MQELPQLKSIEFLPGVGPVKAKVLASELHIYTFQDLLDYFPFRYVDKSKFYQVREIVSDTAFVQLKGNLIKVNEMGSGRSLRLTAIFEDRTGQIELIWFKGIRWIKPTLKYNQTYIVFGKPSLFNGKWNIAHPEMELESSARIKLGSNFKPVYNTSEKLSSKGLHSNGIAKLTQNLLPQIKGAIPETMPKWMLDKFQFPDRESSYMSIHAPVNAEDQVKALNRFKFEELLYLQLILYKQKINQTTRTPGVRFAKVGQLFNAFYEEHLAFDLTEAQKRVVKEIRADLNAGYHMNRLLQGDVGSGKTIVAVLSALLAIDNGFQVCLMAPTEILAQQHLETFTELLSKLEVKVALLTGSVKKSNRTPIHEGLESGEIDILIGTHALIEPGVQFKNLGIAIIDEQHRFGVAQRAKLWKKAVLPPHILVMTATPIPRTLAMTVYGDLDVSVIDELPPGRKEVKTVHRTDANRLNVFAFLKQEIEKGRQIYIVYPLIEESATLDYKDLMDGYESISRSFPPPHFQIGIVHGRMKPEDKDYEMRRFAKGETNILVATTVIEVGVNIPNSSVMVIESTERFGLSQLHQLRGRVGRGADQSYCILMSGEQVSQDAQTRIQTMCRTTDGFEIAEVDLNLRGPGDIMGTQQSGITDLRVADLTKDQEILKTARYTARDILEKDPDLELTENQLIKKNLALALKSRPNWSKIS